MPTYDLRNKETGEIKEMIISISKKEEMVASGEWEQVHLGVADLVTHTGTMLGKTSSDWQNKLSQIKKATTSRRKGFSKNTIHD